MAWVENFNCSNHSTPLCFGINMMILDSHLMCPSLHLSALHNRHILVGLFFAGTSVLNHVYNVHAVNHLAKDYMLLVQEGGGCSCDKELAAVGVGARILPFSVNTLEHIRR
jgi:hypothetical protein